MREQKVALSMLGGFENLPRPNLGRSSGYKGSEAAEGRFQKWRPERGSGEFSTTKNARAS